MAYINSVFILLMLRAVNKLL